MKGCERCESGETLRKMNDVANGIGCGCGCLVIVIVFLALMLMLVVL